MQTTSDLPFIALILTLGKLAKGMRTDDVARVAGITRARAYRVFQGRVLPSGDEMHRLLQAVGFDPGLMQQVCQLSIATGGPQRWNPLIAALTLQAPTAELPMLTVDSCPLTIDTIAFTADVTDHSQFNWICNRLEPRRISDHYRCSRGRGSLKVAYSPVKGKRSAQRRRFCRIEFKPAEVLFSLADFRQRDALVSLVTVADLATSSLTRVDVAIDVPCAPSMVQGFGSRHRQGSAIVSDRGLETVYSGSRRSKSYYTFYDKVNEQLYRQVISVDQANSGPVTRFEHRQRSLGLPLGRLTEIESSLFAGFRMLHMRSVGLPIDRWLLVEFARVVGVPALKQLLPADRFEELVADLEIAGAQLMFPHPRRVVAARFAGEAQRLLRALGVSGGAP